VNNQIYFKATNGRLTQNVKMLTRTLCYPLRVPTLLKGRQQLNENVTNLEVQYLLVSSITPFYQSSTSLTLLKILFGRMAVTYENVSFQLL